MQATISKTYEEQVLTPARDMAGLYSIIEGATGHRDAPIWPALGKSREAFTAMLVAANAYYLSLATHPPRKPAAIPIRSKRPFLSCPTSPTTTCSGWRCSA